jgi:hypothetical protein
MKKTILLLILLVNLSIFSQKISEQNTHKETHLITKNTIRDSLSKKQESINFTRDSLEKEILFYRVKEDYYTTALSDQANRFTLIITGILALFAIISFGAFKYEVLKIREETDIKLKNHKKSIKEYKKQLYETNKELKSAKGNLSTSIAKYFEKEDDHANAFCYYLAAAKAHGESKKDKETLEASEEKPFGVCLINLGLSLDCLNKIESSKHKEKLKSNLTTILKAMDGIHNLNDNEVKKIIAEIRIKFLNIIE